MEISKSRSHAFNAVLLVISCLMIISGAEVQFGDKYVFLQKSGSSSDEDLAGLLELKWPENVENRQVEDCRMTVDQKVIDEVLRTVEDPRIVKVTDRYFDYLRMDCNEISRRRRRRKVPDLQEGLFYQSRSQNDNKSPNAHMHDDSGWHIIYPDTKWCGSGDVAANDDDLGTEVEADKCCRTHDFCDDVMFAGTSKNGLTNDGKFTKLSCKCDNDFFDCLERVNTDTSNSVGLLYFNVLSNKCYEPDYPFSETCKEYRTFLHLFCKEYERDYSAPKVYQWKDARHYRHIPHTAAGAVYILYDRGFMPLPIG